MNKMTPKVSVVIPVFNVSIYIKQSLKSILNQTYKNFEVLIIDDGSTDSTLKIVKTFKDKRIKILKNNKNSGLVVSINKGIETARGEYIARFDGDDISDIFRIKKQVKFLDENPEYIVIGTQAQDIDQNGQHIGQTLVPETDQQIRRVKYKKNFMIHPTVMMRTDIVKKVGGYRKFFKGGAEEYDLWLRLLRHGKFYNIPEKLIQKRIHASAFTQRQRFKRIEIYAIIARLINLPLVRNIGLDGLIGVFTFLVYKFWLISLLFKNRTVPPEPDDVYHYLFSATKGFQIETFEDFRLLPFTVWINSIKNLFGQNYENAFLINFYLGTLLLFVVLIFLIRKLTKNTLHRVILLIFLAQFSGSGAYHGFYWVVPSFYQLMSFLVLLAIIISETKIKRLYLIVASAIFAVLHPSSLLVSAFFLMLSILSWMLIRNIRLAVNSLLIFATIIFSYLIYTLIGLNLPLSGSTLISPSENLNIINQFLSGNLSSASWVIVKREYFSILFFHPLSITGFLSCLILTWRYFNQKLVLTYISILAVSLISTLHPFGYRVLEFLWPITFLIFGTGTIALYEVFLKKSNKNLSKMLILMMALGFVFLANILNLAWISYLNNHKNYNWDRNCPKKLIGMTNGPVYFSDWDNFYAFRTYDFPESNSYSLDKKNIDQAFIIVVSVPTNTPQVKQTNPISNFIINNITRKTPYPNLKIADHSWYKDSIDKDKFVGFKTVIDCDYFKIQTR